MDIPGFKKLIFFTVKNQPVNAMKKALRIRDLLKISPGQRSGMCLTGQFLITCILYLP